MLFDDLRLRPVFGATQAQRITTTAVKQFISKHKESEAANATINRELEILKSGVAGAAGLNNP